MRAASKQSLSPRAARLVLAGLLLLLLAGLRTGSPPTKAVKQGEGDVALFEEVGRRVRRGEPYYPAMGSELRQRGYPTASVFNWRTPFPIEAVALFPRLTAAAFIALGLLVLIGTVALLAKAAPEIMAIGVLAQVGVTVSLLAEPRYVLMAEAWAGFLLVLSAVAYGRRWWTAGASLGVLALLARELAAPYCVVCGVIALARRRWREAAVWAAGAAVYLMFLMFHVAQVSAQLGPHELPHKASWIQFGGLPFLLRVISFIGWYDVLPAWSRAVGCVLILASFWAKEAPLQLRAMAAAFLVFFSVVGQPFNQYWGLVTGPAFAVATAYGIGGLLRLVKSARPATTARSAAL